MEQDKDDRSYRVGRAPMGAEVSPGWSMTLHTKHCQQAIMGKPRGNVDMQIPVEFR